MTKKQKQVKKTSNLQESKYLSVSQYRFVMKHEDKEVWGSEKCTYR